MYIVVGGDTMIMRPTNTQVARLGQWLAVPGRSSAFDVRSFVRFFANLNRPLGPLEAAQTERVLRQRCMGHTTAMKWRGFRTYHFSTRLVCCQ